MLLPQKIGDENASFDCYAIGQEIGLATKAINNVVRLLAQANFIRKKEGSHIVLSEQGKKLAQRLLG